MKKFRTKFQIACETLDAIDTKSVILKSNLVLTVNISNSRLNTFLEEFLKRKLIDTVKLSLVERGQGQAKIGYIITELGRVTCDKLYNINNEFIWINDLDLVN